MVEALKVLFLIFMVVAIVGLITLFVIEITSFSGFKKPQKPQSTTPPFVQKMWSEHITRELEKSVYAKEKYKNLNEEIKILGINKPILETYVKSEKEKAGD